MGRKQERLRQYILFFPAACFIVVNAITGCQLPVESPDLSPGNDQPVNLPETPAARDTEPNLEQLEAQLLDQADASINKGEVVSALQTVAEAISCCEGHFSGRASELIRSALAHPHYRLNNHKYVFNCLNRLKTALPATGCGPAAGCWVTALSEMLTQKNEIHELKGTLRSREATIQTLKKQIAQLKAVDLELVEP